MTEEEWLDIFKRIGAEARKRTTEICGTPKAREELGMGAGGDVTVQIDKVVEEILIENLKAVGNVRLISEESGMMEFGDPEVTVIADPLDGSFNAKMGIPLFTISLALAGSEGTMGAISLGYVKNLVNGDEYHGIKGSGAFFNGDLIRTSERTDISVIGMECHPDTVMALKQNLALVNDDTRLRCLGCITLDLCHIARGIYDTFIDVRGRGCRIMDMAAGKVIIEEAGGVLTDGAGDPIDRKKINIDTRVNIIASGNRVVHDKVLMILTSKGLMF